MFEIKSKKSLLVMALLLGSGAAHASYMMGCQMTGRVVDCKKADVYRYDIKTTGQAGHTMYGFDLAVSAVKPFGRADSDCREKFLHQTVHVRIIDMPRSVWNKLKNGRRLTVFYQAFNDRAHPETIETFALTRNKLGVW